MHYYLDTVTLAFYVWDENGDPVTGLVKGDFTVSLYDSARVKQSSGFYSITERGEGQYDLSFTSDVAGTWSLHISYSDEGTSTPAVDFDLFTSFEVDEKVGRILGLENENQYIYSMTYDTSFKKVTGATIELYDTKAHCQTHDHATGLICTYTLTATYDAATGLLSTYQVVKN